MHYYFKAPLSLSNTEDEKRFGLASQLSIQCKHCGHVNYVETSLTHKSAVTGGTVYNINTKAALAGLHTGIGETHMREILSVMDIPAMSRSPWKTREWEAGKAVESIAQQSCIATIDKEKEQAIIDGKTPDESNLLPISCSYDMGWQKRGKGFNSNTGQSAAMGVHTGKIMDYITKNKTCRTCQHAKKNNVTPRKQGPRSNFWIEGAECLASQGWEGGRGNNRVPILASFLFNFFPFFSTCSCFLLGFFPFFISKYWKKYMYVLSTPILLLDVRVRFPKITAKMSVMRCS